MGALGLGILHVKLQHRSLRKIARPRAGLSGLQTFIQTNTSCFEVAEQVSTGGAGEYCIDPASETGGFEILPTTLEAQ